MTELEPLIKAFVEANTLLKDECGVEGECEEFRNTNDTGSIQVVDAYDLH